jgi:hypothetical protein
MVLVTGWMVVIWMVDGMESGIKHFWVQLSGHLFIEKKVIISSAHHQLRVDGKIGLSRWLVVVVALKDWIWLV